MMTEISTDDFRRKELSSIFSEKTVNSLENIVKPEIEVRDEENLISDSEVLLQIEPIEVKSENLKFVENVDGANYSAASVKIEHGDAEEDIYDPLDICNVQIDDVNNPIFKSESPTSEENKLQPQSILKSLLLSVQPNKNVIETSNVKEMSNLTFDYINVDNLDDIDIDNPHVCEFCNRGFPYKSFLDRHRIIHTGQRFYQCEICEKTFTNSSNLNRHKLAHSTEKLFVCDICNRSFTYKSTLKEHRLLHINKNLYVCQICNKSFNYKQSLIQHKLTHTGIKPYVCRICNKTFTKKTILQTHLFSHSSEKLYKCQECNKNFSLKSNLSRHEKDFHSKT